jgi:drug/metabolite transporter (DMT)-like permease
MLSVSFIFFALGYISCSIGPPFLNKQVLRYAPFPFLFSGLRTSIGIFIVLFLVWRSPTPTSLIPPRSVLWTLIPSVAVYAVLCLFYSYGTYVSSVDFRLLFRMSGLFWNTLFGFVFLGESITLRHCFPLLLVILGLFLSMYDFQWSTELLSSKWQTLSLISELIVESTSSLLSKRASAAVQNTSFSYNCVIFYQYLTAVLSYFLSAFVHERQAFDAKVLSLKLLGTLAFSGMLGETADVLYMHLHKEATMMNLGFVRLVRSLCCLICSHFVLSETRWNFRQISGAAVLFGAGILHLLLQNAKPKDKSR